MQVNLVNSYANTIVQQSHEHREQQNKKQNTNHEKLLINAKTSSKNSENVNVLIDNTLISKKEVENILYLAVNKGVKLRNTANSYGKFINQTV